MEFLTVILPLIPTLNLQYQSEYQRQNQNLRTLKARPAHLIRTILANLRLTALGRRASIFAAVRPSCNLDFALHFTSFRSSIRYAHSGSPHGVRLLYSRASSLLSSTNVP